MSAARIRRLTLSNFRSYRAAALTVDAQFAVLVGPNGAGKTNLIEAISFLAPGRGLRRATLDEVAFAEGDGSWAAAAELEGALGLATLGTGITPQSLEDAPLTRKCRIDGDDGERALDSVLGLEDRRGAARERKTERDGSMHGGKSSVARARASRRPQEAPLDRLTPQPCRSI